MAGRAQELGDAYLGKNVAEALRRHVGRFQREEAVEQPIDVGGGRSLQVTVIVELPQLALLGAQALAHRGAEHVVDRILVAAIEAHPRAHIDRGLARQQAKRVGDPVPAQRLVEQRDQVDAASDAGENVADIARGDGSESLAPPQSGIEIGMLGPEEAHQRQWAFFHPAQWPQKKRLAGAIESNDDQGRYAGPRAHVVLPGGKEIEPLIGRCERTAVLQAAPERLRRHRVVEHLDARDLAGAPRAGGRRERSAGVVADGDIHPVCVAAGALTPILWTGPPGWQRIINKELGYSPTLNWGIEHLLA